MVAHLPIVALLLAVVGSQMACAQVPPEYQVILDKHNAHRAKHGVPPLVWDSGLQADAQAYANSCPAGHSSDRNGAGENLWAGIGYSKESCNSQLSDDYYNENKDYNYDDPGASKGATGHFTQLVWKDTQKIGCAIQMNCGSALGMNEDAGRKVAISVCRYFPPGNVQVSGDTYKLYKEQVPRPGSAPSGKAASNPSDAAAAKPDTAAKPPPPSTTTNSNRRVAAPKTPPADPPAAPVNPPPATPPPAAPVVAAPVVPPAPAPKPAPPAKKGKKHSKKNKKHSKKSKRHWKWVLVSRKDDTEVYELRLVP